jgi:hypothetical protein
MAECKLQVLFENKKEKNYIPLSVFGGSIFAYTEFQCSHCYLFNLVFKTGFAHVLQLWKT